MYSYTESLLYAMCGSGMPLWWKRKNATENGDGTCFYHIGSKTQTYEVLVENIIATLIVTLATYIHFQCVARWICCVTLIFFQKYIIHIDLLQCLHFAGYGTYARITSRQKQTNREASWKYPLALSSSFDTQMKTMYTFFYFIAS